MIERTLVIIKPRALRENKLGKILAMIENENFKMFAGKTVKLSKRQIEEFYYMHRNKDFYEGLVEFMTSGPSFVCVWEGEDIIDRMRKLMGPTDPENAEEKTIRKLFGYNIRQNAIHGSDSEISASYEIAFFFAKYELLRL